MNKAILLVSTLMFCVASSAHDNHAKTNAAEHVDVSPGLLKAREYFKSLEQKALAEPFRGVQTKEGKVDSLYQIAKTGIDNTALVAAGSDFLTSLTDEDRHAVSFDIKSDEWRQWSNVDNGIYLRKGLSFKSLSQKQKEKLMSLLAASLSIQGMEKVQAIMRSEHTLKELNGYPEHLDEELYFISIFGEPDYQKPWGWQYEGHHLALNFFVLGDQVVMSPVFMGAEPTISTSGKYKGNEVLQEEQRLGLTLMQSLDDRQQKSAVIGAKRPTNMLAAANKDNLVLDYEGVQVSTFNKVQKAHLKKLIETYVNNMNLEHAKLKMSEIETHLNESYFAWVGNVDDNAVFYYRFHSPVILIEFDHQAPVGLPKSKGPRKAIRQHIHTMVRTPNGNDYGKDLLGQHLKHHH